MLSIVDVKPPTPAQLRSLSVSDLAIMTRLVVIFKERMRKYVDIDPFTTRDPLDQNDDYAYSIVLDRRNYARVISLIAAVKDPLSTLPWDDILKETFLHLQTSKEEVSVLKQELMPKDNNNFYPYRRDTIVAGYIAFASQICGLH